MRYVNMTINIEKEEEKDRIYFLNTGKKRPPSYVNLRYSPKEDNSLLNVLTYQLFEEVTL